MLMNFLVMAQIKDDPFDKKPFEARPNCSKEYRFKYDVVINSVEEFIAFLKTHQSKGSIVEFSPTEHF